MTYSEIFNIFPKISAGFEFFLYFLYVLSYLKQLTVRVCFYKTFAMNYLFSLKLLTLFFFAYDMRVTEFLNRLTDPYTT